MDECLDFASWRQALCGRALRPTFSISHAGSHAASPQMLNIKVAFGVARVGELEGTISFKLQQLSSVRLTKDIQIARHLK